MKKIYIVLVMFILTNLGSAQVGIGTTSPNGTLHVVLEPSMSNGVVSNYVNTSNSNSFIGDLQVLADFSASNNFKIGRRTVIQNFGGGNGVTTGLEIDVQDHQTGAGTRDLYGINVTSFVSAAAGGTITNYGMRSDVIGSAATAYAGYFTGDVYSTGSYLPSDNNLKQNINTYNGALDKIGKLQVKNYEFRTEAYPLLNLPEGQQVGLISQNVQEVFPNLVKHADYTPKRVAKSVAEASELKYTDIEETTNGENDLVEIGDRVEILSVNYTGLIPVLLKGIQEQQELIERQNEQINKLEARIRILEEKTNQ